MVKLIFNNLHKFNVTKKGYVFSILAIIIGVLAYAFFSAQLFTPNYLEIQDQIDTRIFQLDREFTFFKESILQQITRYSLYYATVEFYNIILEDEIIRASFENDYENFQNTIFTLAINGSFDGAPVIGMENKTIPYLISFYEDFFNNSLLADFEYELIGGRIYEITPLYIKADVEYNLSLTSRELDLEIYDSTLIRPSFSVEGLRDPQIALYVNNETAELLTQEKESPIFQGNWTLQLFNETFSRGYVTTFEFPEFRYTLGTSFIRSILNSTNRGLYSDILSFLSFEYDRSAQPYDTANYNYTHSLYGSTVFLASFSNISQRIDETSYGFNVDLSDPGIDCTIIGINGNGCEINSLVEIENLEISGSDFMMSFWINYDGLDTGTQNLIETSEFIITLNKDLRQLQFEGALETSENFQRNNISFNPNRWSNLIVRTTSDGRILLLVNGEIRYSNTIEGSFNSISNIQFGNAQFDEIVIINRSVSNAEVSRIVSQRSSLFLEYSQSLHNYGFYVFNNSEYIDLNLSHKLNGSFNEFAVEFWVRFDNMGGNGGNLIFMENILGNEFLGVNISSNQLDFYGIDRGSSPFNIQTGLSDNFMDNRYKHIVIQKRNSGDVEIYLNSNLIRNQTNAISNNLGGFDNARLFGENSNFYGVLDEFVTYNRVFSQSEINSHYYNFKSEVGGCCNYFKLYNENTHGVNPDIRNALPTIFVSDIDNYNSYDIILTQRNATSQIDGQWEEELFDACQVYIYNMEKYSNIQNVVPGTIGSRCYNLIAQGIY
ncbi:MAG: LamG domain-containing protein [Nanoarchaeota archaeon]|nr:LamG domain-containing protein [Nanoarchaeota archaeon]